MWTCPSLTRRSQPTSSHESSHASLPLVSRLLLPLRVCPSYPSCLSYPPARPTRPAMSARPLPSQRRPHPPPPTPLRRGQGLHEQAHDDRGHLRCASHAGSAGHPQGGVGGAHQQVPFQAGRGRRQGLLCVPTAIEQATQYQTPHTASLHRFRPLWRLTQHEQAPLPETSPRVPMISIAPIASLLDFLASSSPRLLISSPPHLLASSPPRLLVSSYSSAASPPPYRLLTIPQASSTTSCATT